MDYLRKLERFPQELKEALALSREIRISQKPHVIVICGVGVAGTVGDLVAGLDGVVPVFVRKKEGLPTFVGQDTLVFCVGDSEEVLQCAQDAVRKQAKLIVLTQGGKVRGFAQGKGVPVFQLPEESGQGLAFFLMPVLMTLVRNGLVPVSPSDVESMIRMLGQVQVQEKAEEIAQAIGDKMPVVFGSAALAPGVEHVKEALNRIARVSAHAGVFPQIVYGDLLAEHRRVHVILFREQSESVLMQRQLDVFKKWAREYKVPFTELAIKGPKVLNRLMLTIRMGEFIAYFLAKRLGRA